MTRKRWARSVSFELDGDLYAVDLDKGYRPLGSGNASWTRDRWRGAAAGDDGEEFSGMGVAAKPTTRDKLTPPAALKVTYRCVWGGHANIEAVRSTAAACVYLNKTDSKLCKCWQKKRF